MSRVEWINISAMVVSDFSNSYKKIGFKNHGKKNCHNLRVLAVVVPFLNLVKNIPDWINGGFTINRIWINYIIFAIFISPGSTLINPGLIAIDYCLIVRDDL